MVLRDLKAGDFFKFLEFVNHGKIPIKVLKYGVYLGFSHIASISLASVYIDKFHPQIVEEFRSNNNGGYASMAQFNCVVDGCIRFLDTDTKVAKLTVKGKN